MGWLTSVSCVGSSWGISKAYIFMEMISGSLVAEGLFFNKKWVRWSALILINQLWQMVILPFKRGLEKLNSRWFKNSLRAAEPNLKKKQKAEQNTLKLVLFVPGWECPTLEIQHHSQGSTGAFPPKCSIQGAMGLTQEMCLGVQTSFNLNNGNLLLSQKIMLLKINVLGLEEGIIIRFIGDLPPEFCKTGAASFWGIFGGLGWLRDGWDLPTVLPKAFIGVEI